MVHKTRFQLYNSMKHHQHTALCTHHLKKSLFPFPLLPPLLCPPPPTLNSFPSGYHLFDAPRVGNVRGAEEGTLS